MYTVSAVILIILVVGMSLLFVPGFTANPVTGEPPAQDLPWNVVPAEPLTLEDNGVVFVVDPATAAAGTVKAGMTNNRDEAIFFGAEYTLQVDLDGAWHDIDVGDMSYIAILYAVNPHDTLELEFQLQPFYGDLPAGAYRLVKHIYLTEPAPDVQPDTVPVAAPFVIE